MTRDAALPHIPSADPNATADVVWRPTEAYLSRNRLLRFMRANGIKSFDELLQRSIDDIRWFWDATVKDLDLEFFEPYSEVLDDSRGIAWTRWFTGGKYNYVHDAVDKHAAGQAAGAPAIIYESETGTVRRYTYRELERAVNRAANALRALGIERGDRVGIFAPMMPETAIAMLACGKIGAIFIPIFSGYAAHAVATRLRDCEAKLLITAGGFTRRGKPVAMKETADEAAAQVPSLKHILVINHSKRADLPWQDGRDVHWDELVSSQSPECATVQTDAEEPYMIIYTSGTTGMPKGALHVHSGFPIKGVQDMAHCFDLQPGDTMFWYSDIGWMMGPWAIGGTLMLGATLFLYDGTPDYPHPDRIWDMIERYGITHLGISPTAIRALMACGDEWIARHPMPSLLILGSTGEPWNPVPWQWYFERAGGGRCPVINYSGGTEISGGILGGYPLLPVKSCAFSGPVLGMAADVVDEQGRSVRGSVGELVIRKPWPGMTRGFWKAPDRYMETYWSRLPELWVHGDWAQIDDDGFWYILGRSDDTIKVAGKRVGPAEIESAAVAHPAVAEAAAIGVPDELKGEKIVCFTILRPDYQPDERLRGEIEQTIIAHLGKPLKPESILFVQNIPKTRNAKIMRRIIRAAYLNQDPGDISALENPEAVDEIRRVH